MTCIVGLKTDDAVYIGGDSAASVYHSSITRSDCKVFINSGFVFGFTSSFRMGQVLRFGFRPPQRRIGIDLYEYMVTEFIDAVRARFHEAGWMQKASGQECGGVFMVGKDGRLFIIYSDFQVAENISDFYAIGSGEDLALGSMFSTKGKKPKERIHTALEAAEEFNGTVRKPFVIESITAGQA